MKVKDSLDDFAADKDPPLLTRLLEAIDDDAVFPLNLASVVIKSEKVTEPDGKKLKFIGETWPATEEELLSFRALCKDAMRDLYKSALYYWINDKKTLVEFNRCVELIEHHVLLLHLKFRYFNAAIINVAERQDHLEEDAMQFLYFMLGVYRVSREDVY